MDEGIQVEEHITRQLSLSELKDNYELINRKSLMEAGCIDLYKAFYNLCHWLEGGDKAWLLKQIPQMIEFYVEKGNQEEVQGLLILKTRVENILIDTTILASKLSREMNLSEEEMKAFTTRRYMEEDVIYRRLDEHQKLTNMKYFIIRGMDFYIELYKGLRRLGYSNKDLRG